MSSRRLPGRTLRRRFTLGSGPLKRTSDRVEVLSRVVLALVLFLAAPLGLLVGAVTRAGVAATAHQQAEARSRVTATLLADAPDDASGNASGNASGEVFVPTPATWTAPGGAARTGEVDTPLGAPAGSTVDVWVDEAGRVTERPLTEGEATAQGVAFGALSALGVVVAGMSAHLVVLWLLERRRSRRWETGWTFVEPLWVSRFR